LLENASRIKQRHFSFAIRESNAQTGRLSMLSDVASAALFLLFFAQHRQITEVWSSFLLHVLRNTQKIASR
jgi:hypothetical protein